MANNQMTDNQMDTNQESVVTEPVKKQKKPIFKKWWFWVIVVLLVGGLVSSAGGSGSSSSSGSTGTKSSGNLTLTSAKANPTKPKAGETVTITASEVDKKVFDSWEINEGSITLADATSSETTFVMPEEKVAITATYRDPDTKTNEGDKTYSKYPISDVSMTYDGFGNYINGTLVNKTDKDLSYISVTFTLYDKDGNVIGTALDNQNNLGAGKTWKFKAIGLITGKAASFEFSEITAY